MPKTTRTGCRRADPVAPATRSGVRVPGTLILDMLPGLFDGLYMVVSCAAVGLDEHDQASDGGRPALGDRVEKL